MTAVLAVLVAGSYVDLPTPCRRGYTVVSKDLDAGSERNIEGLLVRDRLTVKRQITVSWTCLSNADKNRLVSLTSAEKIGLRYHDVQDDTVRYGQFYRGSDYSIEPMSQFDGTAFTFFDVSMTFTEY